jgi:transposase
VELQAQIASFQLQLLELRKFIFTGKQEKFKTDSTAHALQASLFANDKIATVVVDTTKQVAGYEKKTTQVRVNHPGRKPLPDSLRREVIYLEPEENVEGLKQVGEEITEVLEYKSAELFVKQYVRPEYIKPSEDGLQAQRVIAQLPSQPIEKSYCSASLLAYIMVSKFVDHLPIYRQLQIFFRNGITLNDNTISNWIHRGCNLLVPLYEAHKKQVLNTRYLHADETTIKVQDKTKKGTTHQGYYWVYYNTLSKTVLFEYQKGRDAIFPKEMLKDYRGYLQCDGYGGYSQFDHSSKITTLNCWAHARRKFFDAQTFDPAKAAEVLSQIQRLYAVEEMCREGNFETDNIRNHRIHFALPILNKLHKILQEQMLTTLPSSPLGKALQYTLARWHKLIRYIEDGNLCIDNNMIENSIRPIAIGRKNYMFAGSHEAAQRAAMLYSLFASCRLHNINPETWLADVLKRINDTKINNIKSLLPQNYKPK